MIMVDSNILLDIFTLDKNWYDWSSDNLTRLAELHELAINEIIYTEISIGFTKIEALEEVLSSNICKIIPISKEALFLAGKVFLQYKTNKGAKNSTLPDFFIGAHASILNISLLTRDVSRYKTYFPKLNLISPT